MCINILVSISNLFPTPPLSAWTVGLIPFKSSPKTNFSHGIHEDFNNNNDYAAVQPCRAPHPSPPFSALPSTHFLSDKTTSGGQRAAGSARVVKAIRQCRAENWNGSESDVNEEKQVIPSYLISSAFHRSSFPDTAWNENVNNRVCVLHLSSRAALNYFANWLSEVAAPGALRWAPAHDQSHSQKGWRWNPARAERRREMQGSAMTFNSMFLCPFSAEQPWDCVCSRPHWRCSWSLLCLCSEINGSRSDPGASWALKTPLDSAGAAPAVALGTPRFSEYWQNISSNKIILQNTCASLNFHVNPVLCWIMTILSFTTSHDFICLL